MHQNGKYSLQISQNFLVRRLAPSTKLRPQNSIGQFVLSQNKCLEIHLSFAQFSLFFSYHQSYCNKSTISYHVTNMMMPSCYILVVYKVQTPTCQHQQHQDIMTTSWRPHDDIMTTSWRPHDDLMTTSWRHHDDIMTTSSRFDRILPPATKTGS